MDCQKKEQHPPGAVTLPSHAFCQLSHGLELAFSLSLDRGIEGQHLRTAISQFLYLLELSGSDAGDPLRLHLRQLTLDRARRTLHEA